MRRLGSLIAAAALGASLLTGCFSKPTPDCAFLCGAGQSCPDGYFCASDGACKKDGLADGFDCGFVAPADASPPSDAGADAPNTPKDAAADAS